MTLGATVRFGDGVESLLGFIADRSGGAEMREDHRTGCVRKVMGEHHKFEIGLFVRSY